MDTFFWRLAFTLYASRIPSRWFEVFAIGFGALMAAMYVVAVFLNPTIPNAVRLLIAAIIVVVGIAHRRVRLERQKGPDALYRKMLATND